MARPQSNNAEYFFHANSMRNHRKVKMLRNKFGSVLGYAFWSMMLEWLTEHDGLEWDYSEMEIEMFASELGVPATEIPPMVEYCTKIGLLSKTDSQFVYSDSLNENLQCLFDKRKRERERSKDRKRKEDGKFSSAKTPESTTSGGVSVAEMPLIEVNRIEGNRSKKRIKPEFVVASLSVQQSKDIFNSVKQSFLKDYATKFDTKYYFIGKDGAKIQSIIKKVVFKMNEKDVLKSFTKEEVSINTNVFLKATFKISDNWLTSNFSLSNIDSKFNEIYSQLKSKVNGRQLSNTKQTSAFAE